MTDKDAQMDDIQEYAPGERARPDVEKAVRDQGGSMFTFSTPPLEEGKDVWPQGVFEENGTVFAERPMPDFLASVFEPADPAVMRDIAGDIADRFLGLPDSERAALAAAQRKHYAEAAAFTEADLRDLTPRDDFYTIRGYRR